MFQRKGVGKINTHILCSITFFSPENRAVCEIVLEKYGTARQATDDITWRMRFACCMTKATEAHLEYRLLTAFTQQQRLREQAVMISYAYNACHILYNCRS